MKHTPGPWHLSPTGRYVRYGPDGANICDLEAFGGPREEGEANARLIAGAPELLEAAGKALGLLRNATLFGESLYASPVAELLRAAIAKAEGGAA